MKYLIKHLSCIYNLSKCEITRKIWFTKNLWVIHVDIEIWYWDIATQKFSTIHRRIKIWAKMWFFEWFYHHDYKTTGTYNQDTDNRFALVGIVLLSLYLCILWLFHYWNLEVGQCVCRHTCQYCWVVSLLSS